VTSPTDAYPYVVCQTTDEIAAATTLAGAWWEPTRDLRCFSSVAAVDIQYDTVYEWRKTAMDTGPTSPL